MKTVSTFAADLKGGDRILLPAVGGFRASTVEAVKRDRWGYDVLHRPDSGEDGPQPLRWQGFGNAERVEKIEAA